MNGINDTLGHDHQRHSVFGTGGSVELLQSRFVGEINFLGGAFEDDNVVAGFQMNGDCWVMREVAGLAGRTSSYEVEAAVEPESQTGIECGRPSGRVVQIQ